MSFITEQGFIIIPREFSPDFKVEVVRTGATDDVSDDALYGRFTLMATEGIGDFEIRLDDSTEIYAQRYAGTETVRVYIDNGKAADTKRFEGKVEKVKKSSKDSLQVTLIGRHISKELLDVLVSKSYTTTETSVVLTNIISAYLTGYTTTNVVATSPAVNVTVDWIDKPFWDCVRDLCQMANYDCFVDDAKDFHFFSRNSILNAEEVVYDDEVIEISGLGDVTFDIKNRIRVYGDIGVIYTADDEDSQATYGIIEATPISDSSIKTYGEAKDRGEGELALLKAKRLQGECAVYGFPSIKSGEKIWISIPEQSIHNKYRVLQVTQEFGSEEDYDFKTTMTIEKPTKEFTFFMRDSQKSIEGKDRSKSLNPSQMKFSYSFNFDDTTNIESQNNTAVSEGKLILASGASSGVMTTSARTADVNITQAYLDYEGSGLDTSTFEISVNNGINWETVTRNSLLTVANVGKQIKIRVTLNVSGSTRPEIDKLWVAYK